MPIKSMTGYGLGFASGPVTVKVEIKAVNHRYTDIIVRCPKELSPFEDKIRRTIQERISRGRVEVYAHIEDFGSGGRTVKINTDLAREYCSAFRELETTLGITVDSSLIPTFPDVLSVEDKTLEPEATWSVTEAALKQALDSVLQMRSEEGLALVRDILARLSVLEGLLDRISLRAPEVVENYRKRLRKRIEEICEFEVDQSRLATEVALFADRCAIDEELVRTRSHISQMREILKQEEPIGRKLDFLIQEINRELNTIGSKSPDADISQLVVEGKSELEKIREQVQNVE